MKSKEHFLAKKHGSVLTPDEINIVTKISGLHSPYSVEEYLIRKDNIQLEWRAATGMDESCTLDDVVNPWGFFNLPERRLFIIDSPFIDYASIKSDDAPTFYSASGKRAWKTLVQYIFSGNNLAVYMPYKDIKKSEIFKTFQSIALINLNTRKKETTNTLSLLKQEIELCDPTHIFCCGTGKWFRELYDCKQSKDYPDDGIFFTEMNNHLAAVIDYYTLENNYPERMYCLSLTTLYDHVFKSLYRRNTDILRRDYPDICLKLGL